MTDDRIDLLIRETLADHPRPEVPAHLTDQVMERLTERSRRPSAGWRRPALAAYWLVASAASLGILAGLEWPGGAREVLAGFAAVLVPLAFAATLWPARLLAWTAAWSRPLLGEAAPLSAARGRR